MGKRKRSSFDDPRRASQNDLPWMNSPKNGRTPQQPKVRDGASLQDQPAMPDISDAKTKTAVFTHQGTLHARQNLDPNASYERLEFLGDAYIQILSSKLIFQRFPNMEPGPMTVLRSSLVRNETLAGFALKYGFDKQARLPTSFDSAKTRIKILGDVFEAYVAGVIVSDPVDGEERAARWLGDLWEPIVSSSDLNSLPSEKEKMAKESLATKIGGSGVIIDYKDDRSPIKEKGKPDRYFIGVYLTGWGRKDLHLGSGEGSKKSAAGQLAAAAALQNPLLTGIISVKKDHDAKVKEEVTQEGAASGRTYEEQLQWNRARNKAIKEART